MRRVLASHERYDMQLTFFDRRRIIEPVAEVFYDRESFIIAVVRIARTKPARFRYEGDYGLVEAIFKIESPNTKVYFQKETP